ncbi:MAG TPA: DUF4390 domain-containing protein [Gammaproteobacteria bacterium]|jgi:hypothetical protein|nr:DUF4390 domain-containing protein [Xanthomonadales bacterium]HOP22059.1 DUF4390 domain-containing protein [Gammaproteobacteria bacterium]MCB1594702.1 DUF4390 domain-containing protein [Xanthomonadales bacterium]MCB1603501.1 DUF4390 domain-containing protein [Xanthomonadales bacterium]HPI95046.1 DUF4390 domain-containing protein [Gammaproteobacteria bacterium]
MHKLNQIFKHKSESFFIGIFIFFIIFYCSIALAKNNIILLNTVSKSSKLIVNPTINFQVSDKIKEAIDNGIRIQFIAKAETFIEKNWWFDETLESQKVNLEVYYFIMSKLYVVKNRDTNEQLSFNNFDDLWIEFEKLINFEFNQADNSDVFVKCRIVLDKGALPTAMQLPVLFDDDWDINTEWFQRKVN